MSVAAGGCSRSRDGGGPPLKNRPASERSPLHGYVDGDGDALHEEPIDPPAPAGDLADEIARFVDLDACVAQRATLDPLVADAVEAIGYDTFLTDGCRMLSAAQAKDERRCDAISAAGLRDRCLTWVAIVAERPESCPWRIPTRRELGRDGYCLALAERLPALCQSVPKVLRAKCLAVVRGDARACAADADGSRRRDGCVREVQRYRRVLRETRPHGPPIVPSGSATVDDGSAERIWVAERGVVLVQAGGGWRWDLGEPRDLHLAQPTVLAEVFGQVSAAELDDEPKPAVLRGFSYGPPREAPCTCSPPTCVPAVTVRLSGERREAVPHRGDGLELEARAQLQCGRRAANIRLSVRTFVADVVRASGLP
jgi:hypothetical protein